MITQQSLYEPLPHSQFYPSADEEHKTKLALKIQKRMAQREEREKYAGFYVPIATTKFEF